MSGEKSVILHDDFTYTTHRILDDALRLRGDSWMGSTGR